MSWSVRIGSIAGTAIRVHVTFLLFLAWIFVAGWSSGGAAAAWTGLAFALLLFACVLAHEFGHIFTAHAFGVPSLDVTLLPIGGVARLAGIPKAAREDILVAIAGPLVNVAIAAILMLITGTRPESRQLIAMGTGHASLIDQLAAANLFLAAFNMIPAFPMDGGQVLRALLATRLGQLRATEIAAAIGQIVAFPLGLAGLVGNPLLFVIALFVYDAARRTRLRSRSARRAGRRHDDSGARDTRAR
jgi:Zn-dependent protease